MSRKEIKLQAKEIVKQRWGILLLVIFLAIAGVAIAGTITMGIGSLIVIGPLLLSQYYILEDVRIGKSGDWKDMLKGFKVGFAESLLAKILLEIILLVPVVIAVIVMISVAASSIVSMLGSFSAGSMGTMGTGGGSGAGAAIGTIFGFLVVIAAALAAIYLKAAYALTFYILMREPGINAVQAMKASRSMMKGHVKEYILFVISFIGWFLLGIVTFYIGFIWIAPYYQMSEIVFLANIYENSTGNFNSILLSEQMEQMESAPSDQKTEKTELAPEPVKEEAEPVPAPAPKPAYNTCIKCGAKLPDGAKFCGKCGTPQ